MKRMFVIAATLVASVSAFSQSFREIVFLKNGSVVKGDIVEFQPDKLIKMETVDGSFFVVDYNDIVKIARERVCCDYHPVHYEPEEFVYDNVSHLKRGYRGFVSCESLLGDYIGGGLSTTHGKQVNEKFFLGGGVGMFVAKNSSEKHYSFPFFADFRFDFLNKKISPFMNIKTGVDFAFKGATGFYGDISFGCRFKKASVSFGVNSMSGEHDWYCYEDGDWVLTGYYNDAYYYDYSDSYYRALNFVTRFSFEF